MANDDILFKTQGWDKLIPYNDYPDELAIFYFKDNIFNENFACHPIFSRRFMELQEGILAPLYNITKCDNTIWDCHPPTRRIYLPAIELEHRQDPYGTEAFPLYEEDNKTYRDNAGFRNEVRAKIMDIIGTKDKVMIGVITGEMARRADFYDYLNQIDKPPNSLNMLVHGQSIAGNRNLIVEQALKNDCSHVLFLDDDVYPGLDIIFKLLKHDKDVVCALQLKRNYPHVPLVFDKYLGDNKFRHLKLEDQSGLVKIEGAGLGAILIKTSVFKHLEEPYFRFGELRKDQMGEDLGFFFKLRELGIESYCDLDCVVGHAFSGIVRPIKTKEGWGFNYDTTGNGSLTVVVKEPEYVPATT